MSKRMMTMLAGLLVVASLPAPASVAGNQVVVAPILDRMTKALEGMSSLKASLTQQKTYGQLGLSDPQEQGLLFIKRKRNRDFLVRLEIKEPAARVITVKHGKFTLFQPRINQVIEGKISKKITSGSSGAGFFLFFFGGLSQVTRDYRITLLGDDVVNGRPTTHLQLTPWNMRKDLYRQIDLWVDNRLWLPTQQRVVELNQDVTLLQLGNVRLNVRLSDKLFVQKLPGNVQHVRG